MHRFARVAPLLFVVAAISAMAQSQTQPPKPKPRPPYPAKWEPQPQEMFVSYWTLELGWSTKLEIRNNVPWRELTVTPELRTSAGQEITLQPVTIAPEDIEMIDLRQAASGIAPELLDRDRLPLR